MAERNKLLAGAQVAAYDLGFEDCLRSFNAAALVETKESAPGTMPAADLWTEVACLTAENAELRTESARALRVWIFLIATAFAVGVLTGRLL